MSLLRSAAQPSSSGKALPHSIKHHGWQSNKQYLMQRTMCAVTENLVGNTNIETAPMPKTRRLILLRHAKSSWEDASLKGRLLKAFHSIAFNRQIFSFQRNVGSSI
jgi:hypothetical protein